MRNRIPRLAVLAAATLVIPPAAAFAQALTLPPRLALAPSYEVPARLLQSRRELSLTEAQAAQLARLSTDLHFQARLQIVSSKPWIAAALGTSPPQAFDRALATLTPEQREPAVRVLASSDEAAQ
jgi:hypothetical protein